MRSLLFLSAFFLIGSTGFTQNIEKEIQPDVKQQIESNYFRHVDLGLGFGIDYGGIFGLKLSYIFLKNVGVFGSVGTQVSGLGWQAGVLGYFIPKFIEKKARPYAKIMYGVNAAIKIQNASEYDKVFTGPTIGIGTEIRFGRQSNNGLNIEVNYPFRSEEYLSDMDDIYYDPNIEIQSEPLPITISIGYHFEF
jgi:hypothetical protein